MSSDNLSALWESRLGRVTGWRRYALSVGLVVAVTLVAQVAGPFFDPSSNLVTLYLLPVVISALFWGAGPSVVASILSILAYRVLFVPRYLALSQVDDYLMFLSVVVVALLVSTLATRAREQALIAQSRADRIAVLYALSGELAATSGLQDIVQVVASRVGAALDCQAAVFLQSGDEAALAAATPGFVPAEGERLQAAGLLRGQTAAASTAPAGGAELVSLTSACCVVGVLTVRLRPGQPPFNAEQQRLLDALASQSAVAIERAQLAEATRRAYLDRETQKLQAALLNSVSHDLRTPLASITGALTSLLDREVTLDDTTRRGLIESAFAEAQQLNHLVGNLLDMTRLEAGALRPVREPCDVQDLIGAALAQLGDRLTGRSVAVDAPVLPMVAMDFGLMTQALVNLLDNALKYSPPDARVDVEARVVDDSMRLVVTDRGVGIPPEALPHVFDSFYRVQYPGNVSGTGLGLSISKGIVELHGGRLTAANRPGGGAVFTIDLPVAAEQQDQAEPSPAEAQA